MVDCPDTLRSGVDIIVSLRVYLKTAAFKPSKPPPDEQSGKSIFNEGQETMSEQILRQRKSALLNLFEVLDLKPTKANQQGKAKAKEPSSYDLVGLSQQKRRLDGSKTRPKVEIVGDGEEIEVEADEEELDKNELDLIYKKYRDKRDNHNETR